MAARGAERGERHLSVDLRRWPEADALIDEALAREPHARAAYLRQVAGHDPALLAALEKIVSEVGRDDGFLDPGGALSGVLGAEVGRAIGATDQPTQVLTPGTFVEEYQIMALLGRGGMGEVYRAVDTRLHREVALKVLPDRFARDPDRLARFRREARVLASLSHPGIGAIYGLAEHGDLEALVLELVEGPTLAERLQGGALPMDDALAVGRRLVEAIAAAHGRGILHRDLKPSNIKVKPDGSVKILDFGLAKALAPDPDLATTSLRELTALAPEVMLGTASYMSPEQARGEPLDERADIWAFGCVLFEMLTGVRAFGGGTTQEILARVIEREPAFGLLPRATSEPIRRLLRRTLQKDPRRRLGYVGDALLDFDEAATLPAAEPTRRRRFGPWRAAALLAVGVCAGGALGLVGAGLLTTEPDQVSRVSLMLPPGDVPPLSYQPSTAVSPDGRTVVYRARRNGVVRLFRRQLDQLEAVPIPGTENATGPFFSPDGLWLGFDGDGVLKRVAMAGGTPVAICPAPGGATATWLRDDTIVFATNTGRVLQRVTASGGQAAALTALDSARGDTLHLLPHALPDGRTVLFTAAAGAVRRIVALRLDTGETRVVTDGTHARYLSDGELLFSREGALWAARFDPDSLQLVGAAVPVVEAVAHTDNTVFHYDVTPGGTLVYLPAGRPVSQQQLVWIDREGRRVPELDPGPYVRVALSPDGTRLALAVEERENTDIWVAEPTRKTMTRLTTEPTIETMPVWSPDGRSVTFRSEREGPGIFRRDAQGAAPVERLTQTSGPIHSPYSWTPDGRTLLLAVFRSFGHQAIAGVTPPEREIRILLDGNFAQLDPQVSPDGRWMAYQSDETGRFEIYIRPYPNVEQGRWQISTGGGASPRWSPDGRELFYFDGTKLLTVPITAGTTFTAGQPRPLFEVSPIGGRLGADYEVAPDGRRFLFIIRSSPAAALPVHLVLVQNWRKELQASLSGVR